MSSYIFKHIPERPLNSQKLQLWLENKLNVLLIGTHGVGKTERILEIFQQNFGSDWAFYNGSTTDPWTDLIGIPSIDSSSGESFIKYVRPQELGTNIRGIYIDELNRAKTATRNALLELIQFKSINGRRFSKLDVIWTSVNPPPSESENEEFFDYDVEELDPAQVDRFHVIFRVSSEPDLNFFVRKYGDRGQNLVSWWKQQPEEAKRIITPRRLEYLAKYVDVIDPNDLLPDCANIKLLKKSINKSPVELEFMELMDQAFKNPKAKKDLIDLIQNENKFEQVKSIMVKENVWWLLNFLSEDRIALFYNENPDQITDYFYQNFDHTSMLFKFLSKQLEKDIVFQKELEKYNKGVPVKNNGPYVKPNNKDETKFLAICNEYNTNFMSKTYTTIVRHKTLDALIKEMPKSISAGALMALMIFLNNYSSKIQSLGAATLENNKFRALCQTYVDLVPNVNIQEPFLVKWSQLGVSFKRKKSRPIQDIENADNFLWAEKDEDEDDNPF